MKEGWKNKPLGSVCRIYNGNSINADYKKEHFLGLKEGYPFIATKDVSFDGRIEYENGVKIPIDAGLKVANPDSVFICVEGGSAGRKIGFIEHQVCFGNKLFCLTPKLDIKGKFLYYYLNSEVFQKQFSERLTGLIGGVSAKKFNEIEIAFPPLSEQQKIVEYLDTSFAKIDTMKANAEKSLNEAKALFQSSLKSLLEPKEGWEEKKLGDVGTFMRGLTYSKGDEADFSDKIVLRSNNVDLISGKLNFDELKYLDPSFEIPEDKLVKKGCLLMCMSNGSKIHLGKVALIDDDYGYAFGGFMAQVKPSNELYPAYFYYALSSPSYKDFVQKLSEGANINNIKVKELSQFTFPVPPTIPEQQSIVNTLDSIKSKVDQLQANYDKISQECDALKQSILKQVFE